MSSTTEYDEYVMRQQQIFQDDEQNKQALLNLKQQDDALRIPVQADAFLRKKYEQLVKEYGEMDKELGEKNKKLREITDLKNETELALSEFIDYAKSFKERVIQIPFFKIDRLREYHKIPSPNYLFLCIDDEEKVKWIKTEFEMKKG